MMKKADFDKRICDVEPATTNTETYREFLVNGIKEIYGQDVKVPNFDRMTEEELNDWIDDIDYLLEK